MDEKQNDGGTGPLTDQFRMAFLQQKSITDYFNTRKECNLFLCGGIWIGWVSH